LKEVFLYKAQKQTSPVNIIFTGLCRLKCFHQLGE